MGIWLTVENDFSSALSINSKTGADDGERGISWTKDGKIVFVSSEGNAQNIWRMDADGSNPKPLTTDYKIGKILPSLSIGGDSITFFKQVTPGNSFFQMDSDGQNVRRVVEDSDCAFAAASANETWVVYTSRAGGIFRIWKVPLKGGDAVKLTDVDSISPAISRDGKSVAYFIREKGKPLKLGIISIDGGDPLKTFELPATTNSEAGIAWNKTGNGILFVNTLGTTSNIFVQPKRCQTDILNRFQRISDRRICTKPGRQPIGCRTRFTQSGHCFDKKYPQINLVLTHHNKITKRTALRSWQPNSVLSIRSFHSSFCPFHLSSAYSHQPHRLIVICPWEKLDSTESTSPSLQSAWVSQLRS